MTEDEMVGCHHQLHGHGFEWTPGVGDGQGGLACCGSWGHKESDTTEQLTHTSHVGKVMLKTLQARLQQYMNRELPDVQAGFRKGRGTRDQIANIRWIIKTAREFQKTISFCLVSYAKAFDCVDHNKLWKTLKEM